VTLPSSSSGGNFVEVQVLLPAPKKRSSDRRFELLFFRVDRSSWFFTRGCSQTARNAAQAWRSDFNCMSRGVCGEFKSSYPHQKREAQTVGLSFSFFVLIGVHGSSRAVARKTPERRASLEKRFSLHEPRRLWSVQVLLPAPKKRSSDRRFELLFFRVDRSSRFFTRVLLTKRRNAA